MIKSNNPMVDVDDIPELFAHIRPTTATDDDDKIKKLGNVIGFVLQQCIQASLQTDKWAVGLIRPNFRIDSWNYDAKKTEWDWSCRSLITFDEAPVKKLRLEISMEKSRLHKYRNKIKESKTYAGTSYISTHGWHVRTKQEKARRAEGVRSILRDVSMFLNPLGYSAKMDSNDFKKLLNPTYSWNTTFTFDICNGNGKPLPDCDDEDDF